MRQLPTLNSLASLRFPPSEIHVGLIRGVISNHSLYDFQPLTETLFHHQLGGREAAAAPSYMIGDIDSLADVEIVRNVYINSVRCYWIANGLKDW